ncbi:TetR family transcriptional regulator [Winogradskya humida]|uniref:TetR family transcriptional regulator n=1 Tax=Winogradskya humida TaxID=113566 RepID=A0ABQ3ZIF5_9ACTN|nr:TetR family transcriptional regulator [Actinoplanes humidus]GIE18363.1 TetR family transcriptional regulator [Actinoplanes humidus]
MGLRERTRQAVKADIAATAMRLFLEQGFDATTMEQIAAEADVSRRSLFRYFESKEDIALGDIAERGVRVQEVLAGRPDSEGPWEALRAALDVLATEMEFTPEWAARITAMFHETPSLRARQVEKQLRWTGQLVPEVERRLGVPPGSAGDPRAAAIVTSALACLNAAVDAWTTGGGKQSVFELYDEAVAAIRA